MRVNLRTDRLTFYAGETAAIEAWVLNDTSRDLRGYKIVATLRQAGQELSSFELDVDAAAVQPTPVGEIPLTVPQVRDRAPFFIDAALLDEHGSPVNHDRMQLEAFERERGAIRPGYGRENLERF